MQADNVGQISSNYQTSFWAFPFRRIAIKKCNEDCFHVLTICCDQELEVQQVAQENQQDLKWGLTKRTLSAQRVQNTISTWNNGQIQGMNRNTWDRILVTVCRYKLILLQPSGFKWRIVIMRLTYIMLHTFYLKVRMNKLFKTIGEFHNYCPIHLPTCMLITEFKTTNITFIWKYQWDS